MPRALVLLFLFLSGCNFLDAFPGRTRAPKLWREPLPEASAYAYPVPSFFQWPYSKGEDGHIYNLRAGERTRNAVYTSRALLWELSQYDNTGNPQHLAYATSEALWVADSLSTTIEHAGRTYRYLPYTFDFSFNGRPLKAPWYSAMAPGALLSVLSRAAARTPAGPLRDRLTERSRELYYGLAYDVPGAPPVRYTDEHGHKWLDEYPTSVHDPVLNGFIFSILGMWDFAVATRGHEGGDVLPDLLETVRAHAMDYRNPGGISYYSPIGKTQNAAYHRIHVHQFEALQQVQGMMGGVTDYGRKDTFFGMMALLLRADADV